MVNAQTLLKGTRMRTASDLFTLSRFRAAGLAVAALVVWLAVSVTPAQEQNFPQLSSRVMDTAGLLNETRAIWLNTKLIEHEKETTNQIVVVTIKSLRGYSIEDYSRNLGNHWGIGQAGKDNGVLLVVAPNERKVRIAVGKGLEYQLTDYTAKLIIDNEILPEFKKGRMPEGILKGAESIISALNGTYQPDTGSGGSGDAPWWVYVLAFLGIGVTRGAGFSSGGGGSFGGGGASGSW